MSAPAHRGARLARVIHVISLVILVLTTGAAVFGGGSAEPPDALFGIATIAVVGGFSTLGRLIVTRTGNSIGWIFLGIGAALAFGLPAEGYLLTSYQTPYVATLPGTDVAGLIAGAMPGVAVMAIPMLFLLFPTGRPPTSRWRWVAWLWLTGAALSVVWLFLRPGEVYGEPERFRIENPIGLEFLEPLRSVFDVGSAAILVSAAASIVSLVVRYRRSRGEERQQLKWLMLVAVAALAIFVAMALLAPFLDDDSVGAAIDNVMWGSLVLVVAVGIPVATALAIFRYRLYDVDVVISKTILYAGLAVFITAAYVAIVVGVGALFGGEGSNAVLQIAATATIALAFQPARERLQRVANRLVYGKRATPYEVMSSFGHRMAAVPSVDEVLPDMAETAARGVGGTGARVTLLLEDGSERSVTWPPGRSVRRPHVLVARRTCGVADRRDRDREACQRTAPSRRTRPARGPRGTRGSRAPQRSARLRPRSEGQGARDADPGDRAVARTARHGARRTAPQAGARASGRDRDRARARSGTRSVRTRSRVTADPDGVQRSLDDLGVRANTALDELRDVARGIFPPLLIDKGLAAALESHVRKSAVETTLEVDPKLAGSRFDPAAENAVYFCCVQALQNAHRHAPGAHVTIRLGVQDPDVLTFVVSDDGSGFDPANVEAREGMQIMTDRVAALGGTIRVDSAPGRGTTVTGALPLPASVLEEAPA